MLTYAHVCKLGTHADVSTASGWGGRSMVADMYVLTYADVCSRMLTYADACTASGSGGRSMAADMYVRHGLFEQAVRLTREVLSLLALLVQMYKYRHLARRLLRVGLGRMPWYADVC